ncbi:hypothetical protein FNW52_08300 [Flavobacterium sp. ZT3R18]|uniref:hypothetical protein n=1 Tax=Flavobacterium sp. ZT3R18 TaxID=2594429 RepID=UPI00117B2765|nr:hypothetical protein [Flavobacterium sp. ZT3R18]TRX36016.1 hypothetical protein FNW52_08300 [Flavobacterium sp. ZT3R18]
MIKIKEVSCSVRKRVKNSVPMVKQPTASSVAVLASKGSSWVRVVCMILDFKSTLNFKVND